MRNFAAALAVLSLVSAEAIAQNQSQITLETVGRVVRLLEDSGYRYTKLSSSVWSITFKGEKMLSGVPVLVMADNQQLVIEGIIAQHGEVADAPDVMRQLLKINGDLSGATLLIDSDDDYVARTRLVLKQVNGSVFKSTVQAVAVATDDAYGAIKPFMSSGAPSGAAGVTTAFGVPPGATQQMDILNGKASVSFNPTKWKETKSAEAGRRTFSHANGDGYAMIISERIQVPIDRLRDIAVANAREESPDVKVVEEQRRRVNGTDMLMLRLEGTANGVPFTYLGYYYGGPAGTIQVITYTGQNLFNEYRKDFEEFLNGFRVQP
jgi:hypothetical protein